METDDETLENGINGCLDSTEGLDFEDSDHKQSLWFSLNKLRKARQLCDQTLVIGAHEVPVHRAVLASSSGYLFDLFLKHEEEGQQNGMCKLKDIEYDSFTYLVDYAYTAR